MIQRIRFIMAFYDNTPEVMQSKSVKVQVSRKKGARPISVWSYLNPILLLIAQFNYQIRYIQTTVIKSNTSENPRPSNYHQHNQLHHAHQSSPFIDYHNNNDIKNIHYMHPRGRIQNDKDHPLIGTNILGRSYSQSVSIRVAPSPKPPLDNNSNKQSPSSIALIQNKTKRAQNRTVRSILWNIIKGANNFLLTVKPQQPATVLERQATFLPDNNINNHSKQWYIITSILAASVPLIALVIPEKSNGPLGFATSFLKNSYGGLLREGPRHFLLKRMGSMLSWVERSVEQLPTFPTLHPQECVKRSICEAYLMPNRYGMIGFVIRLLFPTSTGNDRLDEDFGVREATSSEVIYPNHQDKSDYQQNQPNPFEVFNKYRYAADYGLKRRLESNGSHELACQEHFDGCMVSLLEVSRNMVDHFLTRR